MFNLSVISTLLLLISAKMSLSMLLPREKQHRKTQSWFYLTVPFGGKSFTKEKKFRLIMFLLSFMTLAKELSQG